MNPRFVRWRSALFQRMVRAAALTALAAVASAGCRCAPPACPLAEVEASVAQRAGIPDRTADWSEGDRLAPAVAEGLTEGDAVRLALAGNTAYRAMLADLGISRARAFDAGLLSDPQLVLFFPLGPKQLEFTLYQAIDAVWMRPIRVRAAELDLEQVAATMVQQGLDVIRDARVAHAELSFAQRRSALAEEARALRAEIAGLAAKRLAAGDISPLEATTSEAELLRAEAAAIGQAQNVELARARLQALLGLVSSDAPLLAVPSPLPALPPQGAEELVHEALAVRPDLRAAELRGEAACERAGLARSQFMKLDAVYDANGKGTKGFESGPGLRLTIPLFNANRGGMAIADSELEKAVRQYATVRDAIAREVRTAHVQAVQAAAQLDVVQQQILPKLRQADALARSAYREGDAAYLLVLETTGQYLDARARELELTVALHRAMAELERSVGHRLARGDASQSSPEPIEAGPSTLPEPAPRPGGLDRDALPDDSAAEAGSGPALRPPRAVQAKEGMATLGVLSSKHADLPDNAEPASPDSGPSRLRFVVGRRAGWLRWGGEAERPENAARHD